MLVFEALSIGSGLVVTVLLWIARFCCKVKVINYVKIDFFYGAGEILTKQRLCQIKDLKRSTWRDIHHCNKLETFHIIMEGVWKGMK